MTLMHPSSNSTGAPGALICGGIKMSMKKLAAVIIAAALASMIVMTGCGSMSSDQSEDSSGATVSEVSDMFSHLSTKDINGNKITSKVFSSSDVTMVNIWATWCSACVSEMDGLGKLAKKYNGKSNVAIKGLVVETDEDTGSVRVGLSKSERANAEKIIKQTGAKYQMLLVGSQMKQIVSQVYAYPTTYFLDSKGKVIGEPISGSRSEDDWVKEIEKKLKEAS